MYITDPTHRAGARPSKTQPPTAARFTTPNAHQCVHQPREGRGRNRQTPPQDKGGARDRPSATKPPTHTTRDDTHGPPRRNTGGPPSGNRQHPTKSSGAAEKRTPLTRRHTPRWGRDGQKKTRRCSWNERGRGDGHHQTPVWDRQRRSPQDHDTTGPKTTPLPPAARKKKQKERGGDEPHPRQLPQTPTPQARTPEGDGKRTRRRTVATRCTTQARKKPESRQNPNSHAHTPPRQEWRGISRAHARTHTHPNAPTRSGGAQRKPEPKHTRPHRTPQPAVAGYKQGTHTNTHTLQHPSQDWRGAAATQAQAHTPAPHLQPGGVGDQAQHAHKHTQTPTAQPGVAGGQPKPKPKHTHQHRRPEPATAGYRQSAHKTTHAPKPQPRMVWCKPKPKPNRKHHKPQPGMEGQNHNPYPNTPTPDPSQGWRGYPNPSPSTTRTQTQTPHNSRKPSVHSPGTEAARAMQVTQPNEIWSPGVRLHPKACAALGLEAERVTPKRL